MRVDVPALVDIAVNLFLGAWVILSIRLEIWGTPEIVVMGFYWGIYSVITLYVSRENSKAVRERQLREWAR